MKIIILHDLEKDLLINYIINPMGIDYKIINLFKRVNNKFFNLLLTGLDFLYLFIYINIKRIDTIITFRDNCDFFQLLSKIFININFFAIQNGNRTKRELVPKYGYGKERPNLLTNYFSFGDYEIDTFNEFGHKIINHLPVGSLRASVYKSQIKNNKKIKNYDICFVSMWRDISFNPKSKLIADETNNMKIADDFLAKYIRESNRTICISLRKRDNDYKETLEYKYYKDLYGSRAIIIENKLFSTYEAMEQSELIISSHSTCCSEAFGWGKKVLYLDFSKDNMYSYFDEDMIVIRENNYNGFKERLNDILYLKEEEYRERTKSYAKYVMNYDSEEPTFIKIQNELKRYL